MYLIKTIKGDITKVTDVQAIIVVQLSRQKSKIFIMN